MLQNKLQAYIGFAIKSNQIIFGFDNLCETNKRVKLIVYCNSVNAKTENKLIDLCNYKKWFLCKLNQGSLGQIVGRDNCKTVGILNKELSRAILQNCDVELKVRGEIKIDK